MKNLIAGIFAASLSIACLADEAKATVDKTAESGGAQTHTKVTALIAAVGDRFSIVRQKQSTGSHMDPYIRKEIKLDAKALNNVVLVGLSDALASTEPNTQRVLLSWNPPAEDEKLLDEKHSLAREHDLEQRLLTHLAEIPQRKDWDEIIAVIPKWHMGEVNGLGPKLSGVGVYVQPLEREKVDENMESTNDEADGDKTTIDPNTGERAHHSTFTSVYFYMQTLTIDAKTMKVTKRDVSFSDTKYHDPTSDAIDVGAQLKPEFLVQAVQKVVANSARRAIEGDITIGEIKAVN